MDLGLFLNWTLDQYCSVCASIIDVRRLDTMALDGTNLVLYDWSRFDRDIALDAWKRRWAELSRWCAGIFLHYLFCEHAVSAVWAGAVLLLQVARHYRQKQGRTLERSRATVLIVRETIYKCVPYACWHPSDTGFRGRGSSKDGCA